MKSLVMMVSAAALLSLSGSGASAAGDVRQSAQGAVSAPRALFNGKDLSGWYSFLRGRGRGNDPRGVFSVKDGVIHVTGEEFGCLTSEEEFSDYHFALEYRFLGGKQHGGKAGWAPDSGILFHSTGPDGGFGGVWMESLEVNLIQGATGDFWGVGKDESGRVALSARVGAEQLAGKFAIHDPNGSAVYTIKGNHRVCRSDIARNWADTNTVALAGNESPLGSWNRVDLYCVGDQVVVEVNGKIVNRGFAVKPSRGRIQLQSEGCAIEFRALVIEPATALPDEAKPNWAALNLRAREQAKSVLRPGEPGRAPFWNGKARAFIHPPAFDFKAVPGAVAYRFTVTEKEGGKAHVFTAKTPWSALTPVWDEVPPGYVSVRVEGVGTDGAVCGVAGTRDCYRAAVFKGPYPASDGDYAGAARRCYAAVARLPQVRGWLTESTPPKGYDLYCYPSKVLGAMIQALVRHAAVTEGREKTEALTIARKMADWLVSVSQPKGAPLEYLPPTYWGDRRQVAIDYAGQNMLMYPFYAANAYFALFRATGDAKYRDAGIRICQTMTRLQNEQGTWWLKVREKDGKPVRPNLIVPEAQVTSALLEAAKLSGNADFARAADRAREYELKGPFATWNWDGQFEDVDPLPPYSNLEKSRPAEFANWMFRQGRVADGCLLVDWSEDQFVVWSDPIHHMDWRHWKMPTALEQYEYYTPIDASMGNLIAAFADAWKATRDPVYREKAKALADCVLRHQRKDGTIPTYFDSRPGSDWVNCMVYTSQCLEALADALKARSFESR